MTRMRHDGFVEFCFFRPGAHRVLVVHDSQNHCRQSLPMTPAGDGWWKAEARLEPGDYRFRYNADGMWFADYAANGLERETRSQDWHSLLVVPENPQDPEIAMTQNPAKSAA